MCFHYRGESLLRLQSYDGDYGHSVGFGYEVGYIGAPFDFLGGMGRFGRLYVACKLPLVERCCIYYDDSFFLLFFPFMF